MHKFTVFTLLFSSMVILVMADLVLNNYWGADFAASSHIQEEETENSTTQISRNTAGLLNENGDEMTTGTPIDTEETSTSSEERSDETLTAQNLEELSSFEEFATAPESSSSEDFSSATITSELISTLNFSEPSLETDWYDGLIFGFWDTEEAFKEDTVFYHKLFDGPDYVGSIYELETSTETKAFEAYQTLRGLAETSISGTMNETNSYGDASFYFNHSTKTNSVFLVFQKNNLVYCFEYTPSYHSSIRSLTEAL